MQDVAEAQRLRSPSITWRCAQLLSLGLPRNPHQLTGEKGSCCEGLVSGGLRAKWVKASQAEARWPGTVWCGEGKKGHKQQAGEAVQTVSRSQFKPGDQSLFHSTRQDLGTGGACCLLLAKLDPRPASSWFRTPSNWQ